MGFRMLRYILCFLAVFSDYSMSLASTHSRLVDDDRFIPLREIAKHPQYSNCCFIESYTFGKETVSFGWIGSGCLIRTTTGALAILTAGHVVSRTSEDYTAIFDDKIKRKAIKSLAFNNSINCDLGLLFLESYPESAVPLELAEFNPEFRPKEKLKGRIIGYQPALRHRNGNIYQNIGQMDIKKIFVKGLFEIKEIPSILKIFPEKKPCCKRQQPLKHSSLREAVALLPDHNATLKRMFEDLIERRMPSYEYSTLSSNTPEKGESRMLPGLSGSPLINESGKVVAIATSGVFRRKISVSNLFFLPPILITALYGGIAHDDLAIGAAIGFSVWFIIDKLYSSVETLISGDQYAASFQPDYFMALDAYTLILEALIDNHHRTTAVTAV